MTWAVKKQPRQPITDLVELGQLYAIDPQNRLYHPDDDDPANWWIGLVVCDSAFKRGYRCVFARPEQRALGAALGAANLLRDRSITSQIPPYYPTTRCLPVGGPPDHLTDLLLTRLA